MTGSRFSVIDLLFFRSISQMMSAAEFIAFILFNMCCLSCCLKTAHLYSRDGRPFCESLHTSLPLMKATCNLDIMAIFHSLVGRFVNDLNLLKIIFKVSSRYFCLYGVNIADFFTIYKIRLHLTVVI